MVGFADVGQSRPLRSSSSHSTRRCARAADPVTLSIDLRIQNILREELGKAIADFAAIGGAAVLLDIRTGRSSAWCRCRTSIPTRRGTASDEARFNRDALGVYEMGSTFKIFNTAMALDAGIVGMNDGFDTRKPIHIGRLHHHRLQAEEPLALGARDLHVLVEHRLGEDGGTGRHRAAAAFHEPPRLPETGCPGTARARHQPIYPSDWKPINTMTIAYGHGIAVTPLHLISGVAADRQWRPAAADDADEARLRRSAAGRRIIREETSEKMRQLLRLVVQGGTGKFADVAGYIVGGKTGTADKQKGRGYRELARRLVRRRVSDERSALRLPHHGG